jgi:uncharacterized protein
MQRGRRKVAFLQRAEPAPAHHGHSGEMHPAHPAAAAVAASLPELPLRPPAHQVDGRAVTWWRMRAAAGLVVSVVPEVVLLVVTGAAWAVALLAVTLTVGVVYVTVVPPWLYRISRWEVTDRAVYTLHGWLVREWRIAPISRVQTVDTARGPLQQLLGLADVTVTTASARGAVRIRGLAADDAAELARVLTETTHATSGDAT